MNGDYLILGHGTVYILQPQSDRAHDWCEEHLPEDALLWGPSGYVIEHRYISDIVIGLQEALDHE